ncbi:CoA-binding protein [Oceanithermus sp.]|jgi:predicted CoA-binding protein
MHVVERDEDLLWILGSSYVVAVLGAHPDPQRAAHYVPAYLKERGYRVIPVNPAYAGSRLFGEVVRARLDEIEEPVDVVDVFRGADRLAEHLEEILAMNPPPAVVWLQKGIRDDAFAKELTDAGITVVQDRCMLAEHRRLL